MLEGVIARVLNQVLGDFIEGIDSKQLNISILAGDVELFNLSIKPTILDNLPLPFKIKHGVVGRIFVDVPVISFIMNPIKIEISEVFLLVSPKEHALWNKEVIEKAFTEGIKSSLENLEEYYRGRLELEKQGPGVAAGLVNTIIDNLHIEVKNVYVRFEDDISFPKIPYCIGVCLESLEIYTCTDSWARKAAGNRDISLKVVKISNLQMYLNFLERNAIDDYTNFDLLTENIDVDDIEDDEIRNIILSKQEKGIRPDPKLVRFK